MVLLLPDASNAAKRPDRNQALTTRSQRLSMSVSTHSPRGVSCSTVNQALTAGNRSDDQDGYTIMQLNACGRLHGFNASLIFVAITLELTQLVSLHRLCPVDPCPSDSFQTGYCFQGLPLAPEGPPSLGTDLKRSERSKSFPLRRICWRSPRR